MSQIQNKSSALARSGKIKSIGGWGVNKNGAIRVKELSEKYGVTEDSIRKDLTLLEKKGLLKKTYGGAVKRRINVHDLHVAQRKDKNIEAKQKIAAKAIDLIKDGDMIFLDISTANLELAKLLVKSYIAMSIADRPGIALGRAGGVLANSIGAGFLGRIISGLFAGILCYYLKKIKLPKAIQSLKSIIIIPVISILATGTAAGSRSLMRLKKPMQFQPKLRQLLRIGSEAKKHRRTNDVIIGRPLF